MCPMLKDTQSIEEQYYKIPKCMGSMEKNISAFIFHFPLSSINLSPVQL